MEVKKTGKGLKVLVGILSLLLLLAVGYIIADKFVLNKKVEEKQTQTVEDKKEETTVQTENLVEGYKFRLKDITCEKGENSCTKNLKVSYDGKNHDVKITKFQDKKEEGYVHLAYNLYVDNNIVEKINAGMTEGSTIDMDFDGYVYVFNNKYLGLLYNVVSPTGVGYDLRFFNDIKRIGESVNVDYGGQSLVVNDTYMDGIDNVNFDGNMLTFWHLACEKPQNADSSDGPNSVIAKIGLTFDGEKVVYKYQNEKKDANGGGQTSACFDINTNTFKD